MHIRRLIGRIRNRFRGPSVERAAFDEELTQQTRVRDETLRKVRAINAEVRARGHR